MEFCIAWFKHKVGLLSLIARINGLLESPFISRMCIIYTECTEKMYPISKGNKIYTIQRRNIARIVNWREERTCGSNFILFYFVLLPTLFCSKRSPSRWIQSAIFFLKLDSDYVGTHPSCWSLTKPFLFNLATICSMDLLFDITTLKKAMKPL